jgi:hypothetical protein
MIYNGKAISNVDFSPTQDMISDKHGRNIVITFTDGSQIFKKYTEVAASIVQYSNNITRITAIMDTESGLKDYLDANLSFD